MMENDPLLNRVRNWFGFGHRSDDEEQADSAYATGETGHSAAQLANRQLLEGIFEFILEHHLPVNEETLAFAHDLVSGRDPCLAGLVRRRVSSREPITCEWIEDVRNEREKDESVALDELRERLEKSIAQFTQTTRDARSATSDYQSALQNHVDELHEVNKAGAVIQELANVAKAMIDRTQEIEHQMARSERETRNLQRRLDEAKRNAEIDHLTGLPNRRAFEAMLENEFADARLRRDALCVAFCDIDKFKLINDTHGHEAGDRVLKVVARTLAEISDDRCHVARHGGEEFVVLFRGKTLREAYETLDATRETLANRKLVNRATDTPFGQVSFSGGLADIFAFRDPRAALKAADEALYVAKDTGRNRIVLANQSGPIQAAA